MLHLSHDSAAKAGVVGLMRALAVELAPHMGHRVNTIHPTSVNTAMIVNEATYNLLFPGAGPAARHGAEKVPAEVAEAFKGIQRHADRVAEPEDISEAVIFLVSDSGRYVSDYTAQRRRRRGRQVDISLALAIALTGRPRVV